MLEAVTTSVIVLMASTPSAEIHFFAWLDRTSRWPELRSVDKRRQVSPRPDSLSGSLGTHRDRIVSQQFSQRATLLISVDWASCCLGAIPAVKRKSGKLNLEQSLHSE